MFFLPFVSSFFFPYSVSIIFIFQSPHAYTFFSFLYTTLLTSFVFWSILYHQFWISSSSIYVFALPCLPIQLFTNDVFFSSSYLFHLQSTLIDFFLHLLRSMSFSHPFWIFIIFFFFYQSSFSSSLTYSLLLYQSISSQFRSFLFNISSFLKWSVVYLPLKSIKVYP